MKKIISLLCAIALVSVVANAQPQKGNDDAWRERVKIEQISYISAELGLTAEQSQAFWPVWNDVHEKRQETFKASVEAFKALQEGVNGPDAAKLLDAYVKAKAAVNDLNAEALERFGKVLPAEKVAKLIVAEETFRRNQIGKLGGKGGHGKGGHGKGGHGKGGHSHQGGFGQGGPRGGFGGGNNMPQDFD